MKEKTEKKKGKELPWNQTKIEILSSEAVLSDFQVNPEKALFVKD